MVRVTWDPDKRPESLREPDSDGYPDSFHLEYIREQHEAADHGVFAIEALVYCYEARIHPPEWLVDWLGNHLAGWLDGHTNTLDQALAVAATGRGKPPPRKRLGLERERQFDAHIMGVLIRVFDVPVDQAAEALQLRSEAQGRETPDASWLAESWRKRWRKDSELGRSFADLYTTKERRQSFLDSFPRGVLSGFE